MTARVLLYTKPGCHLCDDARAVVEHVCAELGESYDEVDITAGPDSAELVRVYGEEIPVTLVDGHRHDFWRVDPDRLRAALARTGGPAGRSGASDGPL
jgi:glutaredoxin